MLVSGRPGEWRMYSDWWTSSLNSQKHLYTDRTLDGCSYDRRRGTPLVLFSFSSMAEARRVNPLPSSV